MKNKNIAIFDLDGTLLRNQSQYLFLKFLLKEGEVSIFKLTPIFFWFFLYKLGLSNSPETVYKYATRIFKEIPYKKLDYLLNRFTKEHLIKYLDLEVLQILNKHEENGDQIIIVSSAIEPIVSRISKHLKIDDYIPSIIEVSNDKIVNINVMYGKRKESALKEMHDFSLFDRIFVYSDNISDLPIFKMATDPIPVNPEYKLKKYAIKHGWDMIKSS